MTVYGAAPSLHAGGKLGIEFVARLATGAQFIRDLIVAAWLASAAGMIGCPAMRDIESGKVEATRELMEAD